MIRLSDVQFGRGFLPGKMPKKTENKLGLTDPKPDYTFGIKRNMHPLPGTAPSDKVKALIGIAPGICYEIWQTALRARDSASSAQELSCQASYDCSRL